jgi:DNA-binding response OmpR family regulator
MRSRRRHPSSDPIVRLGPTAPIPLIGRDAEKKELLGPGPIVMVAPAGMGKTALARTLPNASWVKCVPGDTAAAVVERARRAPAERWVVDDVHLLGDEAAALVERLGQVVAISERHVPAGRNLELGPLSLVDARAMWIRLEETFGPTPKDACDVALERVRGVPLALRREYAQALLGLRRPWDITTLDPTERAVLEATAVLFAPAPPAALAHLTDRRSDTAIETALRGLGRRQLVTALPDGRFEVHDVVRTAVLSALSADDRRDLERRAAALEGGTVSPKTWERFEATPGPMDDVAALAAAVRHLAAAGDDEAAAARLAGAEDLFVRRAAYAEALVLAAPLRADLTSFRAGMLVRRGRVADARALAPVDPVRRAEIALEGADVRAAERALAGAPAASVRAIAARIQAEKGGALPASIAADEGRLPAAEAELLARIAEARAGGAELRALHAERELAALYLLRGRTSRAAELAGAVIRRADEGGLGALAREARMISATADADDFRVEEALAAARILHPDPRATRVAARAAAWVGGATAPELGTDLDDQIAHADAAWSRGDTAAALEGLVRAAPLAERAGRRATLARILADAARLHHALGHRSAAQSAAARALAEGAELGIDGAVARALLVNAALARDSGDLPIARTAADDALTVARVAALPIERAVAAGAAEALARAAGDMVVRETLANVTHAASATLTVAAQTAVDRMLAELGLAAGCAFRIVVADGASSYAASATPALAAIERRDLAIDGVNDRVIRRGRVIADLRRRTLLKRLLFLFAGAPGRLYPKEDIVSRVWGVSYHPLRHDAALFTNVMRLRRLLGENGQDILRVGEGGYRFVPPPDFLFVEKL